MASRPRAYRGRDGGRGRGAPAGRRGPGEGDRNFDRRYPFNSRVGNPGFHAGPGTARAGHPRRARHRRRVLVATGAVLAAGAVLPPAPAGAAPADPRAAAAPADPVRRAVLRAERGGLIAPQQALAYRRLYREARALRRRLRGVRRRELGGAIATLRSIAARGRLTGSRMAALFLILRRNREWWARRGPPPPGPASPVAENRRCAAIPGGGGGVARPPARVRFAGSRLVFQHYPGHGLQLQPLANFGAAASYWAQRTPEADAALEELLDELIELASVRGGFTAWEYYFPFGGGSAPWISAISQGTAIQVLARAAIRLDRPDYFEVARDALGAFETRTPAGVKVRLARDGNWYALYSFAPGLRVLNAHLKAAIGLYDFAALANDDRARLLYRQGLRAARRRIGGFDTGHWSKYANPGRPANLGYHVLNRRLARELCRRSGEPAICRAWRRFSRYLSERCPVTERASPSPAATRRFDRLAAPS